MKSRYTEIAIGAILGVILVFAIYFISQYFVGRNYDKEQKYNVQSGTKIDSIQAGNYKIEIKQRSEVQIKEFNDVMNERIKSLNDRLGDIYLSFGLIIALLLAIVAGVYIKTETEVAKHMNRNYGSYKKEIEIMVAQAQAMLSEIKTNAELSQQIIPKQTEQQEQQIP